MDRFGFSGKASSERSLKRHRGGGRSTLFRPTRLRTTTLRAGSSLRHATPETLYLPHRSPILRADVCATVTSTSPTRSLPPSSAARAAPVAPLRRQHHAPRQYRFQEALSRRQHPDALGDGRRKGGHDKICLCRLERIVNACLIDRLASVAGKTHRKPF